MASIASSQAGSSANLVLPTREKSNWKSVFFCLSVSTRVLFFLIVVGTFGLVAHQWYHQKSMEKSIVCYECISFTGMQVAEPGLPYEKNCMNGPKNTRKCNPGQLCSFVRVQAGKVSRVHRSCSDGKRTGCASSSKPTQGKYCYCNSDRCLK